MAYVTAFGHNIVVREESSGKTSASGIMFEDKKKWGELAHGVVLSKGTLVSDEIKVGDEVCYLAKSGTEVSKDNKYTERIMEENTVLGWYKED